MLLWPVGNDYHHVNHPFGEPRSYGLHEGLDLYGQSGDLVFASMSGEVIWASNQRQSGGDSKYGNHIIIEHPNGWVTWYAHLEEMLVKEGMRVLLGDHIGLVGSTGNSTGPHLHYTLQIPGAGLDGFIVPDVVDPAKYLR